MKTYIETIEMPFNESGPQAIELHDRPIKVLQVVPLHREKEIVIGVTMILSPRHWDKETEGFSFFIAREGESLEHLPPNMHYLGSPLHAVHVWSSIPKA